MRKLIIVDADTNEKVGDYKPKKRVRKKSHSFYLMYYESLAKIDINLTSSMIAILGEMNLQNRIEANVTLFNTLSQNYKIKRSTLEVNLHRMCQAGLAFRTSKNIYYINPYYFSKANEYKVNTLRVEYGKILAENFELQKQKPQSKRVASLEKQIQDILNN